MAAAEQPLKKRKLHEPLPEPPPPPPPPFPSPSENPTEPPPTLHRSFVAPPLSQEEIARRRRNREEIRSMYDCYKRIKFCVSKIEARLMPDLEQAYLSLITASRGCTSVQRIVADLIPRYASYCPTALEAAAKVIINMHNWSLAVISSGEDIDGVAFETAKACIFGLVDICNTASSEAPTSSVIRGICSVVFSDVLVFFTTSFEGKDIFTIVDKEISKIEDSAEFFFEAKQKLSDEDESALTKLSKFRVLTLLRIFFCCPKNSLSACFELLGSTMTEEVYKDGLYFLHQVTSRLDVDNTAYHSDSNRNERKSSADSMETVSEGNNKVTIARLESDGNHVSGDISILRNHLLGLVLGKDPSLKSWILSKYKKLCKSASSEVVSEITSILEGIFESPMELAKVEDSRVESDGDDSDPSKNIGGHYVVPRLSNQNEISSDISGRDSSSRIHDGFSNNDLANKYSGQYLKPHSSVLPIEADLEFETVEQGDLSRGRSSTPRELLNNQFSSPVTRTPLDFRTNSFEGRKYFDQVEKNQDSQSGLSLPALRSSSGGVNTAFESPNHRLGAHPSTTSQVVWYSDGDPAAIDIFSASKQLWVGSLGPGSSEALVRFQFEKFGPLEQFLYFPFKGFATIEYRNIMDAIRAREVMRGHSPWGACLRIKFLDIGLGTRGAINGVAVGYSCQVYVGNVSSQWARDEILHESMKVVYKGPRMVTDLTNEGALLMEFETPEEAATAMAHLRQHRKDNGYYQAVLESPANSYRTRMSRLSSLLSSLRTKYNIAHNSVYIDNHISGNYHASSLRVEDRLPSSTLWINIPNSNPPFLADDELVAICDLAMGNVGSVVRLTRNNLQIGSCWFVECSSVEAANTLLQNLRDSPGIFFHIEFSQPGKHHAAPLTVNPESSSSELVSPRINPESHGIAMHSGYSFQSNWSAFGGADTPEVGARKHDGYDNSIAVNPSRAGGHAVSGVTGQPWMYNRPEIELQSGSGSIPPPPQSTHGPPIPPPQSFQPPPFMRPVYFPPSSSWDVRGLNHHPSNPISPGVMHTNPHGNNVAPPFLPASVTPLAQIHGGSMQHQMFPMPVVLPPPLASLPPPLPPSPPPLPQSMPPWVPPPPSSPPPVPPPPEASNSEGPVQALQHWWQGALCKSGVHYCTVYAQRVDSNICKYSNAISEPAEWPAKLDMTKRTDFRHVKSTFTSTPLHKREVCWLLPSSAGDQKGFQDFISYLKQRECAGVIKIPAAKSMWARLLFILPYSDEASSLLSIAPNPPDCLIALVLPKEINFDWV